jgi:hypothetical protein
MEQVLNSFKLYFLIWKYVVILLTTVGVVLIIIKLLDKTFWVSDKEYSFKWYQENIKKKTFLVFNPKYTLLDLIFDIFLHFKLLNHDRAILSIIVFILFNLSFAYMITVIPFVFYFLLRYVFELIVMFLYKNGEINKPNIKNYCIVNNKISNTLRIYYNLLPKTTAYLILYIFLKKSFKFDLTSIEKIALTRIVGKPHWLLINIINLSTTIYSHFKKNELYRKSYLIWPKIIWLKIKFSFFEHGLDKLIQYDLLLSHTRIYVNKRKIFTNGLEQWIRNIMLQCPENLIILNKFITANVGGLRHLAATTESGKSGFVFTSSDNYETKSGIIDAYKLEQRPNGYIQYILPTTLHESTIKDDIYLNTFKYLQAKTINDFVGMRLKLSLLFAGTISNKFLFQYPDPNKKIIIEYLTNVHLKELEQHSEPGKPNFIHINLSFKSFVLWEEKLKEEYEALEELSNMTYQDIFKIYNDITQDILYSGSYTEDKIRAVLKIRNKLYEESESFFKYLQ